MEKISREEALEKGLKFYFTGIPCRKGGVAERYAKTGACRCQLCKDALKERQNTEWHREKFRANAKQYYWNNTEECKRKAKKYRKENPDKVREYKRRWIEENKERHMEYFEQYRKNNPDKISKYYKKYYEKNKHEYARRCKEYRERINKVTPQWYDPSKAKDLYDLADKLRDATGEDWDVDHIIPVKAEKVCGLHWHENLQVIPATLNRSKGNKLKYTGYLEWLQEYDRPLYSPVSLS